MDSVEKKDLTLYHRSSFNCNALQHNRTHLPGENCRPASYPEAVDIENHWINKRLAGEKGAPQS
jgi:hypothetical protein